MDDTPRKRLARVMAGVPANSSPMPSATGGMSPMPASSPYNFLPPYAGLKNDMSLPPFEQPGGSLPMDRYMQPAPQAPAPPQMQPSMGASMGTPMQAGGQGWGGPEPAPGTIPAEYDPNLDPRYLPEQWRGAFNDRWQK
jgi:hypothetical protein